MTKISSIYHFLSAFTALILLLSISAPAILHASGLADCDMDPAEHAAHPMSDVVGDDHCDEAAHNEANHEDEDQDTEADPEMEACSWSFNCSCKIETAVPSNAIPTLSKITAGFTQAVIQTINFSPETKIVNSAEQIFVSLYSPPLFLKNSSFLN